jgi:serine/threonine-protein kinase
MIGARLGNWYLEREIGRGGMGAVYRGRSFDDPPAVAAVKVLAHPLTKAADFQHRFPAEMLGLRRLKHPHVAASNTSGHGSLPRSRSRPAASGPSTNSQA